MQGFYYMLIVVKRQCDKAGPEGRWRRRRKDPPQTRQLTVVEGSAARLRGGHTWVSYSLVDGSGSGWEVNRCRGREVHPVIMTKLLVAGCAT